MSASRCLIACVLLSVTASVDAARGQDVWTIGTASAGSMIDVAAGPRGSYLALAMAGDEASVVLRVDANGTTRRLARATSSCQSIAALANGAAMVACEDALLRVRADGQRRPQAIQWPVTVRYIDAVAAAPGGIIAAVVTGEGDGQVFRVHRDGTVVRVAGGGTRRATTDGVRATQLRLGELTSLAADGTGFVFVHEEDGGDLVRHVDAGGAVRTLVGGGPPTPLRDGLPGQSAKIGMYLPYEGRPDVAVLPGGDVLLTASFIERRRSVEHLVSVDARSGRLRILATPEYGVGFNFGDGGPLMGASLHAAAVAAGADGDVAIVHGERPTALRWLDSPRASRLAIAVTATSTSPPTVSVHATHRARMTITVRHRGRTVRRLQARGQRATFALDRLRSGTYAVHVTATDGQARRATDDVPLHIGSNPTTGDDCERVSSVRVDCLHPETSLNDYQFGYVVVLRADGQLWRTDVDPDSAPGAPIPTDTVWRWVE